MKFGVISWNFDILLITIWLKFESKNPFAHNDAYNFDYLLHNTFSSCLIDLQLNVDFSFQFCDFYRKIKKKN